MELCTWKPYVLGNLTNTDLNQYLEFSQSACVAGGPCSTDRALHVLYLSGGDLKKAIKRLLGVENIDESVVETTSWSREEVKKFEELLSHHGKNFNYISRDLKTKTVNHCVSFYYLWKHSSTRSHRAIGTVIDSNNNSLNQSGSREISMNSQSSDKSSDQFPCKVCGQIFLKIKSRSAHMKRHKNGR